MMILSYLQHRQNCLLLLHVLRRLLVGLTLLGKRKSSRLRRLWKQSTPVVVKTNVVVLSLRTVMATKMMGLVCQILVAVVSKIHHRSYYNNKNQTCPSQSRVKKEKKILRISTTPPLPTFSTTIRLVVRYVSSH